MSECRCGDDQAWLAAIFKQGRVETECAGNDGGFLFDEDCPGGEQQRAAGAMVQSEGQRQEMQRQASACRYEAVARERDPPNGRE